MPNNPATKSWRRLPLLLAALVFLTSAAASAMLIWRLDQVRLLDERMQVSSLAGDHAQAIQRNIERILSATYALAALVRQGDGTLDNFTEVARQMLPLYPGADSLQLAPGGTTRHIVPLAGNEKGVGHDLLNDPLRSKEALLARDSGKLTLAGPFELVQGGMGAVGRFPVFLEAENGGKTFWGFTSVVIRFPQVLDTARLPQLTERGFDYKLWRMHPDSGERQIIAESSSLPLIEPVEQSLQLPNGVWTLSIAPVAGWNNPAGLLFRSALGLLFSLLLAWLAKLLVESKAHEAGLENLVAIRTAEILEREERLRLLEDNLPDSYVFQYHHQNDGTPQFLYLSAGMEKLHGLSRQDVLRDAGVLHRQVEPEQLPALMTAERASLDGLRDFQMELRMRRSDGEWRWFQVRSRPRRRPDGQVLWDGVATDITERKKAEQALLRQTAELRQRNEELERFDAAAVGRELQMIGLKGKINELSLRLGQPAPYDLTVFADEDLAPAGRPGEPGEPT